MSSRGLPSQWDLQTHFATMPSARLRPEEVGKCRVRIVCCSQSLGSVSSQFVPCDQCIVDTFKVDTRHDQVSAELYLESYHTLS